jgi:hypothetical protein
MELGALKKITAAAAADIARSAKLSAEAEALLARATTPAAYLGALIEAGLETDALRFLAFALPKREAVWWACLAARDALAADNRPEVAACLEAVEAWVYRPDEEKRRQTFPLAEAVGFETPAGYAALAAFWSGGSIAPPDAPEVSPDPALTPTMAGAAVLLAAVKPDPLKAPAKHRLAIARGIDIANGGNGRLQREA